MNAVERAVDRVGGPTAASFVCRVSIAAIYRWRIQGYVHDARAAVKLSHASGVSVEELAGVAAEGGEEGPRPAPRRRRGKLSATYPAPEVPAAASEPAPRAA